MLFFISKDLRIGRKKPYIKRDFEAMIDEETNEATVAKIRGDNKPGLISPAREVCATKISENSEIDEI